MIVVLCSGFSCSSYYYPNCIRKIGDRRRRKKKKIMMNIIVWCAFLSNRVRSRFKHPGVVPECSVAQEVPIYFETKDQLILNKAKSCAENN